MLVWTVVCVLVSWGAVKLLGWLLGYRRFVAAMAKLPHRPQHWLWGNLHTHPGIGPAQYGYARGWIKEFPRMFVEWFGPFDARVSVHHPDTAKVILKTAEPKSPFYYYLRPWLGDGLLLSAGKKWSRNRRLLTNAFHFDILKPYMAVNNECTDTFLEKLDKYAETDGKLELFENVSLLTLDAILKCAFSYAADCQRSGSNDEYIKAVFRICQIVTKRTISPWFTNDWVFTVFGEGREQAKLCRVLKKVANHTIQERKKALANNNEPTKNYKYLDFLDVLLTAKDAEGNGLSDVEILDEVNTFLFEGHDTTSSGITWTLYLLAKHPKYQARCQEEIDAVLEGRTEVHWEDLAKLEFTTMCIKEAMRHASVVPFIGRHLTQDMTIDGYFVPAGTCVDIRVWFLHHNAAVWENEEEYLPERFSPDKMEKMDPYAFVPFSAGPRNCIGQHFAMHEMKTVVAKALHRYHWDVDPDNEPGMVPSLVQKSSDGVHVRVTRR